MFHLLLIYSVKKRHTTGLIFSWSDSAILAWSKIRGYLKTLV